MFTNVIVPLDGSHEAAAAIPVARTLAALDGARLSLLRVVHCPVGVFASHVNQVREASASLDAVVCDKLAGVDLPIATHVRSGDVVEAILDEVNGSTSSVIVMTTRGHVGVVRAVVGSVASELLGKSPVPVVLVRAGVRRSTRCGRFSCRSTPHPKASRLWRPEPGLQGPRAQT